jgi:hypothetical protein
MIGDDLSGADFFAPAISWGRRSSLFMLDLSDFSCISHERCVADYRLDVPPGLSSVPSRDLTMAGNPLPSPYFLVKVFIKSRLGCLYICKIFHLNGLGIKILKTKGLETILPEIIGKLLPFPHYFYFINWKKLECHL